MSYTGIKEGYIHYALIYNADTENLNVDDKK
jgi:hypothetical protein